MSSWQIFSAVALRRLPELVPRKDIIESRVQEIFSAWEVAKSKLSNHEMEHLKDLSVKESGDPDVIIKETAQDRLDRWLKEKSSFEFGQYDESLTLTKYLFVRQKFGTDIKEQWLLPQAAYDSNLDKSLLDTARRAICELLDIKNGYTIVSKIPSSLYTFRYPNKIVEMTGYRGARVFFLKAHIDSPSDSVSKALNSNLDDRLKWLTKNEANDLVNKKYMASFSQGLLHENRVNTDYVLSRAAGYAGTLNRAKETRVV